MKAPTPTTATGLTSMPSQSSTTSSLLHPQQHFIRHPLPMYPKYQQSWHHLDCQRHQLCRQQFHKFSHHWHKLHHQHHQHKLCHQHHQPQEQQDHHIPPHTKHHSQPPKAERKKCLKE